MKIFDSQLPRYKIMSQWNDKYKVKYKWDASFMFIFLIVTIILVLKKNNNFIFSKQPLTDLVFEPLLFFLG